MPADKTKPWLSILHWLPLIVAALYLRSDWTYRTAFTDEAINLYEGWRMLYGQTSYLMNYHMGWPVLSAVPLAAVDALGGVAYARGLNALFGALTSLIVMLIAQRVYGRLAGYIAGALFAVCGPAIFISTLATYDSLSALLISLGLYLWLHAFTQHKALLFSLGSLALAAGVLTKYSSILVVGAAIAYVALILFVGISRRAEEDDALVVQVDRDRLRILALLVIPLLILPIYAAVYRAPLLNLWQTQVLTKQSGNPMAGWDILYRFLRYLWLPLLLSVPALLAGRRKAISWGLLIVGLSMIPYHLVNRDDSTLFKHTVYMLVGLAPVAGAGIFTLVERIALSWSKTARTLFFILLGTACVFYFGWFGQKELVGFRSFWSDTSLLMSDLSVRVQEGDLVLMEQGAIGRYYLIARGRPGHRPADVVDTWWFQDEKGTGKPAYERAIAEQRFAFIIFDYTVTESFDRELLASMEGQYALDTTYPARIFGDRGVIDLFRPIR